MAGKNTVGVDTSKCSADVPFSRNRTANSDSGQAQQQHDGEVDLDSNRGGGGAVRVRLRRRIRHLRSRSSRPRPSSSNSDSDMDEGDVSQDGRRLGLRCYFASGTSSITRTDDAAAGEASSSSAAAVTTVVDDEEQQRFDWVWDKEIKSQASQVSPDEREVNFHLEYSCGTAASRGSMEMADGQHYWEIKMVSAVYGTDMMVGIGTKEINFSHYAQTFCSLLGNDNNGESCGLSYTGVFHFAGTTNKFCEKFGQKDVIGVHLNMWKGSLTYYKNGQNLGVAKTGLVGKSWYPMVCSTAARSSMRLIRAITYPSSLQFMCCTVLRRHIPPEQDVLTALSFPPGLKNYLNDRLDWLLGCQVDTTVKVPCYNKATQTLLTMKGKLLNTEQDDTSDEV